MRKTLSGVGLALGLSVACGAPAEAQESAGLPRFRPSAYGRSLLGSESSGDAADPSPTRPTRRGRRALTTQAASAPRPRRRARRRGARGALLGEAPGGEYALARQDPGYGGLDASQQIAGYRQIAGQPFVQGPGDASAAAVNDVKQGYLGDCYFLASLAAVANTNPGLLEGMVSDNGDGTYTVRLFELPFEAAWMVPHAFGLDLPGTTRFRDVVVDGEFPAYADGRTTFAKESGDRSDQGPELWVMLAEKAYAKLKGDYEDIGEGGLPGLALNAITGSGSERESFGLGGAEALEDRLRQALADGRPIVMGSKKRLWGDERLPGNVVQGHAYAVVSVEGDRFQLYNPWGRDQPRSMTAAELKEAFNALNIGGRAGE